jgi:DNA repair exonuclease SbcCD ATPase subunit
MEEGKETLRDRMFSLYSNFDELARQREDHTKVIKGLETEVKQISSDKEELDYTWQSLRSLQDKFSAESIGMLKDMLNKGVQAIFPDRNYSIEMEISDTKRKQLKIYLDEDGERTELTDTMLLSGGGVLVPLSLIFRVYLIIIYDKRRFIFTDEGVTNVSQAYVEPFMQFMKHLVSEMGFQFPMVNHDPRFEPYVDSIYEVVKGNVKLRS